MKSVHVKVALALLAFLFTLPAAAPALARPATAVQPQAQSTASTSINLAHLDALSQQVTIGGQQMLIIHVYSEYPDYKWVDASGEGIACVDDAARAVVVYLNDYKQTHNEQSLNKARELLTFVMHMEANDGEFYNFIQKDLTINTDGATSKKSFDWWAMRAMWALGSGYNVFKHEDPAFAEKLQSSFLLANTALQQKIDSKYGSYILLHGYKIPAWIDGFDAMSNALLGLTEFYQARPLNVVKDSMLKVGRGLAEYQYGSNTQFPFGAHLDWNGSVSLWHAYGSGQSFALARAGMLLHQNGWIASAKQEADQLFTHLLVTGMINQMAPTPDKNGQIAYGVDMLTQGFMAVYQATHDPRYARDAGIAASWFTCNNDAHFAMYDPAHGYGYDGLDGTTGKVSLNSGAESTIEALMALQVVNQNPVALSMANVKTIERHTASIYEAEASKITAGNPQIITPTSSWTGEALYSGQIVKMSNNDQLQQDLQVTHAGKYMLSAALVKPHTLTGVLALEIGIDGHHVSTIRVQRSPDIDYLTLVGAEHPFSLSTGKHTLTVTLKGEANASLVVDNFVLQPLKEFAVFQMPNGSHFTLMHDLTGDRD
ncbi:hypothetical protein KDW_23680 [Dictyobacter vulcani]|uniref:Uncharacterized protein n=1 Tax=Dictyobacter vulcani TaxID=2607529 RepID=A0A5J4KSL9_9CHLR|nr:hypothetical protein [Dictyobacter vulcani]GER88206.1 hypothetical protein KDW_23680 [Dictyobacter vulcani]